ncbi:MAG: heme NO-binding domain-containing protein [Flavobacteriaceae bacterium]|nr:heme NO-binding domain-containing protein [Flavobacteriaceae bacterium]
MKGIVFTEFLEMVEQKFGIETLEEIIEKSNLKSKGIYTAVGTYEFAEMLSLITNLSQETNINPQALLHAYGIYFFDVLTRKHAKIFEYYTSAIELLGGIEKHIHVHVRKMYPDAELPYFDVVEEGSNKLALEYHSERAMYQFALGLMERTLEHYGEKATITKELLNENGTKVLFTLVKT